MIASVGHLETAAIAHTRRACAKPDLPPGRAYNTRCRASFGCIFSRDCATQPNPLPRSGLAHAASGEGASCA